eukprot:12244451-Alexandrium_andersonii.AAC.1
MPGGEPDPPPGLGARVKRSRSAGAAPSTSTAPTSSSASATPTAAPVSLGPLGGAAGVYRRAPGGPAEQATPAEPDPA